MLAVGWGGGGFAVRGRNGGDGIEAGDKFGNAGQGQPVIDMLAGFLVGDDAGTLKHRKVMGDCGPAKPAAAHEITDATVGMAGQFADDAEACL